MSEENLDCLSKNTEVLCMLTSRFGKLEGRYEEFYQRVIDELECLEICDDNEIILLFIRLGVDDLLPSVNHALLISPHVILRRKEIASIIKEEAITERMEYVESYVILSRVYRIGIILFELGKVSEDVLGDLIRALTKIDNKFEELGIRGEDVRELHQMKIPSREEIEGLFCY